MGAHTDVIIVSGFLGSGKTTLLNRLTKAVPEGYRVVVLMNEFGEIGIDGQVLQGEDLDILEINRGSIFCICVKRDFIAALYKIANEINPDLLIMEPTGVANPGDLKSDFRLPMFKDRFRILDQICILDAVSFEEAYAAFVSVEKQISASSFFIINKVDLAGREQIERIKEIVRGHRPSAQFLESVFCDIPLDSIVTKLDAAGAGGPGEEPHRRPLTSGDLDDVVSMILADPFREITPPDNLMSCAYSWHGNKLSEFREFVRELPGGVVRGKGFVADGAKTYLFSMVMGRDPSFEEFGSAVQPDLIGKVVLIFPPDIEESISLAVSGWSSRLETLKADPGGADGAAASGVPTDIAAQL